MENRLKYFVATVFAVAGVGAAYYYPAETFMAFVAGFVFGIPAAVLVYMVYGLWVYRRERKHRITVTIKPTEVMKALARREAELKREKELLYNELQEGKIR